VSEAPVITAAPRTLTRRLVPLQVAVGVSGVGSLSRAGWTRNSSSSGTVDPIAPSRSAMKPSTETLIE
jgi:hypothetical protein